MFSHQDGFLSKKAHSMAHGAFLTNLKHIRKRGLKHQKNTWIIFLASSTAQIPYSKKNAYSQVVNCDQINVFK